MIKIFAFIFCILAIVGIGTGYFYFTKRTTTLISIAEKAENSGNFTQSQASYAEALLKLTPAQTGPNVNHSKAFNAEVWKKEVKSHIDWVFSQKIKKAKSYSKVVEGITRTFGKATNDIDFKETSIQPVTQEQFKKIWFTSFFAPAILVDSSQGELASRVFTNNGSIVSFTSETNYTYELNLVHTFTGRRVYLNALPGTTVRCVLSAGDYFVICKSQVEFSPGTVWKSLYTVLPIKVPEKTSSLSFVMETRVQRK